MKSIIWYLKLLSLTLLWQPSNASSCGAETYQVPGHVLLNHVIKSIFGVTSSVSCLDHCEDSQSCHSINWYSKTGLCELNSGTHLSYPEGLAFNPTARYILYSGRPMTKCSKKFCNEGDICLMETDGISYRCQSACALPLGMQNGRIKDSQITASSIYPTGNLQPFYARLHNTVPGCWSAASASLGQYLQIDLTTMHIISKIATQGRHANGLQCVELYKVLYSQNGLGWTTYKYGGIVKEFQGNNDQDTVVTNTLPLPITTRFIRIEPLKWAGWVSMRMELYGCASS